MFGHQPAAPTVASEKLDGKTWFLHREDGVAALLSPAGKAIMGVPVTTIPAPFWALGPAS